MVQNYPQSGTDFDLGVRAPKLPVVYNTVLLRVTQGSLPNDVTFCLMASAGYTSVTRV